MKQLAPIGSTTLPVPSDILPNFTIRLIGMIVIAQPKQKLPSYPPDVCSKPRPLTRLRFLMHSGV